MPIETLQALATLVLALSAANERLIEAIKNLFPKQLAKERTADGVLDPIKDRKRQLQVQLLSIGSAFVIGGWVAAPPDAWFGWWLPLGTGPDARRIHVALLALLTSGGSAFWNGILDFAREAAKLREKKADAARAVTTRLAAEAAAAAGLTLTGQAPSSIVIQL